MRLRFKSHERRLWRRIKLEFRRSPSLRKEYKLARRAFSRRRTTNSTFAVGFLGLIYVLGAAGGAIAKIRDTNLLLIALSSFISAVVLWISALFNGKLTRSTESFIFSHFPVKDRDLFDLFWRRTVVISLAPALLTLVIYGYLGMICQFGIAKWFAGGMLVVLTWILSCMMALLLGRYYSSLRLGWVTAAMFGLSLLCFYAPDALSPYAERMWPIVFVTPVAWINFAFREALMLNHWAGMIFALPVLGFAPFAYRALKTAAASFQIDSHLSDPHYTPEWFQQHCDDAEVIAPGVRSNIERAATDEDGGGRCGFIERFAIRTLNTREKQLASFVNVAGRFVSNQWYLSIKAAVIGLIVAELLRAKWPYLSGVVAVIALAVGTPVLGGRWRVFSSINVYNVLIPLHAMFPAGYWELSRMLWKINIIRIICWIPVGIIVAAVAGWRLGVSDFGPVEMVRAMLLAVVAISVAQPYWIAVKFHYNATSSNMSWRSFFAIVLIVLSGLGLIALAVSGIFVPSMAWRTGMLLALLLGSLFVWWLMGVIYNRARMDLIYLSSIPGQLS